MLRLINWACGSDPSLDFGNPVQHVYRDYVKKTKMFASWDTPVTAESMGGDGEEYKEDTRSGI